MSIGGTLANWFGQKLGLGIEDYPLWRRVFGFADKDRIKADAEAAMSLSCWWANVRLHAETIGTLPFELYEELGDGKRRPAEKHDLYSLLKYEPNADQTAPEFWEGHLAHMIVKGNAFAEKKFSGERLVALQPLAGAQVERTESGALKYTVADRGRSYELPEDKVFHTRGFGFGGDVGCSVVEFATSSLQGALATDRAARRMFTGGMRASGFLQSPVVLTEPQRKQLQKNVIDPVTGPDSEGAVAVLEAGMKWVPTNIPAKDAEMILSRRFNVEDICRWFGTPPILVGHAAEGQTMFGSGVEQIVLFWLVLGLRRYIVRVERSISKRLLSRFDRQTHKLEINFEALLRADSEGRARLMATLAQNGLRTRDELRAIDHLPGVPGGNQATVQSNLVPLDKLGVASSSAANDVRNALVAWLTEAREQTEKDRRAA